MLNFEITDAQGVLAVQYQELMPWQGAANAYADHGAAQTEAAPGDGPHPDPPKPR
ncbi:hypothetical protein V8J88_05360 [Massilia sp. W12]|uniref:hypothetical protein n=1 Tax=Massilia sp. W12 TaxID=3126507 RepID=UPI0030D5EAF3